MAKHRHLDGHIAAGASHAPQDGEQAAEAWVEEADCHAAGILLPIDVVVKVQLAPWIDFLAPTGVRTAR